MSSFRRVIMPVKRDGRLCNAVRLMAVLLALLGSSSDAAFVMGGCGVRSRRRLSSSRSENLRATNDDSDGGVSIESYRHNGFKLTYLHKRASPGREGDRPVILIHPVGIGMSSWFWKRLMESCSGDNPPIYAPDLIGCGLDHGADAWDPEEKGLFFPLSWVEGVETLMKTIVIPRREEGRPPSPPSRFFGDTRNDAGGGGCLVVAQGGLAPVGIMLADRNPLAVGGLMLTSPPTYEDVTTAVPGPELRRNYALLRSPAIGGPAFSVLESRGVVRFFSDLFLFRDACDREWLDEAGRESRAREARTPVQAFNAGLLQHRSFERELRESPQPMCVVSGEGDGRVSGRQSYRSELEKCTLVSIEGCNVLPWENPSGVVELIKELGY